MNYNEPSGTVFTSAYSGEVGIIMYHPSIIQELRSPDYDLYDAKIVLVLPNEEPPPGAYPVVTYNNGKRVVVKDINGMARGKGRYYRLP